VECGPHPLIFAAIYSAWCMSRRSRAHGTSAALIFAEKHDEKYNFLSQMHQGGPGGPRDPLGASWVPPGRLLHASRCFPDASKAMIDPSPMISQQ